MLLNLPLFLTNYSSFPTILAHFPHHGNKPKSNPLNYRPIAITSLISKTMETIITKRLLTFLETSNLSDHQYGFRKARSTGNLLAYAVHVWSSALESSSPSSISWRSFHLYGHCSQEIREIIPGPLRRFTTTRSSTHSHPFQVSLPNPQTLSHKSSFIPRTCNSWKVLPSSCFPEPYNLPSFKSETKKLDLISLSS